MRRDPSLLCNPPFLSKLFLVKRKTQGMRPNITRSESTGGIWRCADKFGLFHHLKTAPKFLIEAPQTCCAHWQPPLSAVWLCHQTAEDQQSQGR